MKLSTTRLALFLALIVCLMVSKTLAHHHDKDCDHDKKYDNDDGDDENDENNDNDNDQDRDDNNNDNENNGQPGSGSLGSTTGRHNTWLGSEWPIATSSNGEGQSTVYYPPGSVPTETSGSATLYPSGSVPNVVTVTLTQVITETMFPTDVKSEPLVGSMASTKLVGIPVLLAAILFAIVLLA